MSHLFRYYVFLRQVLEGVGVVFSTTNMEHNWKQWNKIYHEGIKERDQDIVGFINAYNLEIEQLGKLSITLDNPSVSVWEPLEGEAATFIEELGFREVCIEGDALIVIKSINAFRFVPQAANVLAHGMAMEGEGWKAFGDEGIFRSGTVFWPLVEQQMYGEDVTGCLQAFMA
ncbi:hypothetical protein GOBAR_DD30242 [Gossypium barbadense]|nr:hypothetical protein GOBAR_DD30242 [Gossypium barbadense]